MGLFTNPVVLSDGTANHTFSFRSQKFDPKYMIGEYIEDAASIESDSKLVTKHDTTKSVTRHLLQRRVLLHPAANTEDTILEPVTVNITVTCDKAFSLAEVQPQVNILLDACTKANFLRNMLLSML